MKTRTIYIADDGTEFTNELMCIGYEAKQKGYPELADKRYVARIAENAFLICAALLGMERDDFINYAIDDDAHFPNHLAGHDITNAFQDLIVNGAINFEKLWQDKGKYENSFDYKEGIFKFAQTLKNNEVLKIPNLTAREERTAQNAYWIYDAMTATFKENPDTKLDRYFDTHPQDDWVAQKAVEFENLSWPGDDYLSEITEFAESEIEKLKEKAIKGENLLSKNGYYIVDFDGTGMLEIQKDDEDKKFANDEEAVKQAIKDGIKIIPIEELPKNFDRKYLGWIDTEVNRKRISIYCNEMYKEEARV